MTGRDESSSPDAGEELDELLEPASELRSAAEQEGESKSPVKSGESGRESSGGAELDEPVSPASSLRSAAERHASSDTDDGDCDGDGGREDE